MKDTDEFGSDNPLQDVSIFASGQIWVSMWSQFDQNMSYSSCGIQNLKSVKDCRIYELLLFSHYRPVKMKGQQVLGQMSTTEIVMFKRLFCLIVF